MVTKIAGTLAGEWKCRRQFIAMRAALFCFILCTKFNSIFIYVYVGKMVYTYRVSQKKVGLVEKKSWQ